VTGWSAFVTWGKACADDELAAEVAAELGATVYDVCLAGWDARYRHTAPACSLIPRGVAPPHRQSLCA
jgi:hypothetical protein